jgi:hypothetical protein
MTKDAITAALSAEGLTASQDTFTIPEEREAIFLVAAPGDVLPVNKVTRAELRDKVICLHTSKDEHFWFTYDLVLGLRVLAAKPGKERLAGFAK